MKVTIKIKIWSKDPYSRYFAYSIDEPLHSSWREWKNRKIISRSYTTSFIVDLPEGRHYVEIAVSSPCRDPYYWDAEIYVNDNLVEKGRVCGNQHLRGYFTIGRPSFFEQIASWFKQFFKW